MGRKALILITIIFLGSLGCNQDIPNEPVHAVELNDPTTEVLTKKDIEKLSYADYGLSSDSREATDNWISYQELSRNVELLKEGDLSFLTQSKDDLVNFWTELNNTLPERLNTKPINARLLALESMLLKANSELTLPNSTTKKQLMELKNVFIAMSNFNDQMNKKFEIESNNILKQQ